MTDKTHVAMHVDREGLRGLWDAQGFGCPIPEIELYYLEDRKDYEKFLKDATLGIQPATCPTCRDRPEIMLFQFKNPVSFKIVATGGNMEQSVVHLLAHILQLLPERGRELPYIG
jgi:hypothetical protein